jgi:glycosyltransferase involved in cell wall biosynthesis
MNILIIGEFSAFAKNLAKGFNKIGGHRVVVISDGDSFKKIEQDENSIVFPEPRNISLLSLTIPKTTRLSLFFQFLKTRRIVKYFYSQFDVVFLMNVGFIRRKYDVFSPYFTIEEINRMRKDKSVVFMSSCGGDLPFFKFAVNDKRFSTVYKDLSITRNPVYAEKEKLALSIVDAVIPMSYQYAAAYRLYGEDFRLLKAIQLPFDNTSVELSHIYHKDRIVIFNGSLRPTKGTIFIEEALKRIEEKYKTRVVIRKDRLPYAEFLKLLPEIDLYVDLCTDYDYGMSAIAAMSAGCVVFSGNEPETRREFEINDIPVIPISPNSDDIVSKISHFVENIDEIEKVGLQSRQYVEKYHECGLIARKYLSAFEEYIKRKDVK